MKFTESKIRALAGPAGKLTKSGKPARDAVVFADHPTGLAVRLDAAAQADSLAGKSYLVQFRVNGVKRRLPLGPCASVKLADAVKAATKHLGLVAQDRDPFAERQEAKRKQERDAYTLAALIDDWAKLHLPARRPNYAKYAPRILRRVFKSLLDRPAAKIDAAAILRVHDHLAKTAPHMAARAIGYASAAFGWAISRQRLKINPFLKLPRAKTTERARVLEDDELRRIWNATAAPGVFNAIVRMLILTGQRREEVAGMTWGELSSDLTTWTLPASRAKNNRAHIVPLPKQARDIVAAQPSPRDSSAMLVFPGMKGSNTYNGYSDAAPALRAASGVENWTIHDLRRTAATNLQRLGVRLEVTESILNHVGGSRSGIVGVYQRFEWRDEKRAALQIWADRLDAIVEGRPVEPSNVVALRA
jgi:integrase